VDLPLLELLFALSAPYRLHHLRGAAVYGMGYTA